MSLLLGPCMTEMEKTKNKRCVQKLVTSGFLLYLEYEKSLISLIRKRESRVVKELALDHRAFCWSLGRKVLFCSEICVCCVLLMSEGTGSF